MSQQAQAPLLNQTVQPPRSLCGLTSSVHTIRHIQKHNMIRIFKLTKEQYHWHRKHTRSGVCLPIAHRLTLRSLPPVMNTRLDFLPMASDLTSASCATNSSILGCRVKERSNLREPWFCIRLKWTEFFIGYNSAKNGCLLTLVTNQHKTFRYNKIDFGSLALVT
jgi:hypothetical protein